MINIMFNVSINMMTPNGGAAEGPGERVAASAL